MGDALNAVSFVASFVAIAMVRTGRGRTSTGERAAERTTLWRDLHEGLRYFAGNRTLKVMLLTSGVEALAAWLASTVLHDMDVTISGVHFGAIDTVFLTAGILVVVAGLDAARALRVRSDPKSASAESVGSSIR